MSLKKRRKNAGVKKLDESHKWPARNMQPEKKTTVPLSQRQRLRNGTVNMMENDLEVQQQVSVGRCSCTLNNESTSKNVDLSINTMKNGRAAEKQPKILRMRVNLLSHDLKRLVVTLRKNLL